ERAILILPPGVEFIIAFYSCLFSGVIPVPVFPPRNYAKDIGKMVNIVKDCGATVVISTWDIYYKILAMSFFYKDFNPKLYQWVTIPKVANMKKDPLYQKEHECQHKPKLEDMAYIQYTSGSTSNPKGVMISYKNIASSLFGMYWNFS